MVHLFLLVIFSFVQYKSWALPTQLSLKISGKLSLDISTKEANWTEMHDRHKLIGSLRQFLILPLARQNPVSNWYQFYAYKNFVIQIQYGMSWPGTKKHTIFMTQEFGL